MNAMALAFLGLSVKHPIDGVREPLAIVLEEVAEGQRLPRVLTERIELECPRHGLSGAHAAARAGR